MNHTIFSDNYDITNGHTMRRNCHFKKESDMTVSIDRPWWHKEGTPITQIDDIVGSFGSNTLSLKRNQMYNTFLEMCEDKAIGRKESYNMMNNLNVITYQIPAIGFISNKSNGTYSQFTTDSKPIEKFIMINGHSYSNMYYYQPEGEHFKKMNVPVDYSEYNNTPLYDDTTERFFNPSKTNTNGKSYDIKYFNENTIHCLSLHPAKLKFKHVFGTNMKNCIKTKNSIKVLDSEPAYISKFALYFRSSKTDGKWINWGTHICSPNIYTPVKVYFDPITVKEIRVVHIEYVGKWENTKIWSIGKSSDMTKISPTITVDYTVSIPRNGIYWNPKIMETCHYNFNEKSHRGIKRSFRYNPDDDI